VAGIDDLDELLRSIEPGRLPGEWVFVSVPDPIVGIDAAAMVRESEGVSYVITRADADARGLEYDVTLAWISLGVHSALDAVGLTAAVSTALAHEGVSCNVIAGAFHDHLLVPVDRAVDAMRVLEALSDSGS
jgi:uncharacterized protein